MDDRRILERTPTITCGATPCGPSTGAQRGRSLMPGDRVARLDRPQKPAVLRGPLQLHGPHAGATPHEASQREQAPECEGEADGADGHQQRAAEGHNRQASERAPVPGRREDRRERQAHERQQQRRWPAGPAEASAALERGAGVEGEAQQRAEGGHEEDELLPGQDAAPGCPTGALVHQPVEQARLVAMTACAGAPLIPGQRGMHRNPLQLMRNLVLQRAVWVQGRDCERRQAQWVHWPATQPLDDGRAVVGVATRGDHREIHDAVRDRADQVLRDLILKAWIIATGLELQLLDSMPRFHIHIPP
eukprot:CAMPEP_0168453864 /NCGR_PEP_ID=MMETSP0228-20121227/49912_1 /TAXON_ID=133427 /ORGANISM="Protoceratium reticulatum, Strain CCCM 535 (=CCMP 1889)" /LENGTH=304 /DNA_ID=CAMNT_0008468607 /DNA_START=129 /DNA_END=1042 /DNA_ORIENTATION=-